MALTEKDIATLAKGMAPAVKDAIASATRPLHEEIANLTTRLAEAEAKSIGPYHGVWQPGFYGKGALVTWGGSMFIAMTGTSSKPGEKGEDSRAWVLAVKRGSDGRDGKDAA